ncbi:MAG: hypothetical protein R3195_06165 [Gemmatimonadota bacterium]|nr:hypothetical protein [Gemmatimonadota bacterium]
MPWECEMCPGGIKVCGDPPPDCLHEAAVKTGSSATVDDYIRGGWKQVDCYCLAIMVKGTDFALVPVDAARCCEDGGEKH